MESGNIGGFAPAWAVAPMKAQQYHLLDSPNERQNKMAQSAPVIPKASFAPVIQPAVGPVTYAEQVGQEIRSSVKDWIANNMAQANQRVTSHYGSLHLVA
jgi:hypothetical protein